VNVATAVQDSVPPAAEAEADRPKRRVVYTTKKKKPTSTQQDTEPEPGLQSLDFFCCSAVAGLA